MGVYVCRTVLRTGAVGSGSEVGRNAVVHVTKRRKQQIRALEDDETAQTTTTRAAKAEKHVCERHRFGSDQKTQIDNMGVASSKLVEDLMEGTNCMYQLGHLFRMD